MILLGNTVYSRQNALLAIHRSFQCVNQRFLASTFRDASPSFCRGNPLRSFIRTIAFAGAMTLGWLLTSELAVSQTKSIDAPAKNATTVRTSDDESSRDHPKTTLVEARTRAAILHETLHGTLQVMHRDFFREDEGLSIPSRSLEDVFAELEKSHGIQLRWIAVDLKAMNVDNEPETGFEERAVKSLKTGKPSFDETEKDVYRFAGRIRLSATCLSCHASRRSSNDDRAAALVISIPLSQDPSDP
ncbi:signal peptide protein [Rhodopirellula europaea 6C]|uniref:Signal peptide protein n=1 Tax=Rhodopirellula europaea 6C TaxID=1263867 RepID=M2B4E5_9BACT|nr:signal peptide protein [Rhodopirellula europaea 6C]